MGLVVLVPIYFLVLFVIYFGDEEREYRLCQPEGGPCATAVGGVFDIEEKEPRAVLGLGLEADGEPAGGGVWRALGPDGGVNANDGGGGRGVGEVLGELAEIGEIGVRGWAWLA